MIKNYGFVKPEFKEQDFFYGGLYSLPKDILQPDGDWTPYLPTYEAQADKYETWACAVFGTESVVEMLVKKIFGNEPNFSERYIYNLLEMKPPIGVDPNRVAQAIRDYFLVNQEELPMPETLAEWMTPRPIPQSLKDKAKQQFKFKLGYETVFDNSPDKKSRLALMRECLKYSPLGISVTAWYQDNGDGYIDNGQPNTHWVVCYAIDNNDHPLVFDTYERKLKRLSPDHHIELCIRYNLTPIEVEEKKSWFANILRIIRENLGFIQKEIITLQDNQLSTTRDVIVNQLSTKPKPPPEVPKRNLLNEFCIAIRDYEGKPGDLNYRNNNPGNLRSVKGGFLKFNTYEEGFNALVNYVIRVKDGKHPAYPKNPTIKKFFSIYAPKEDDNDPDLYAKTVAQKVGLSVEDTLSKLV